MSRSILFVALASVAGCMFQGQSPTEVLRENVHSLNDETRWGRVDLASERVTSSYRPSFLSARRDWGADVRIADTELTALILAPDLSTATSTIEITWYDQRTMEVSATVIRQRWVQNESGFLLDEETILGGDDTLFHVEEEEEEEGIRPSREG